MPGKEAAAIAGLPPTNLCYDDAFEIRRERFGNESLLVQDHMAKPSDVQPVKFAHDVWGLQRLRDNLKSHIWGLQALGMQEAAFATLLESMVLQLLSEELLLAFNKSILHRKGESVSSPAEGPASDTVNRTGSAAPDWN